MRGPVISLGNYSQQSVCLNVWSLLSTPELSNEIQFIGEDLDYSRHYTLGFFQSLSLYILLCNTRAGIISADNIYQENRYKTS